MIWLILYSTYSTFQEVYGFTEMYLTYAEPIIKNSSIINFDRLRVKYIEGRRTGEWI